MGNKFIYKLTTEFTEKELISLKKIFLDSFGWTLSEKSFNQKYKSNYLGFSFHVLVKDKKDEFKGVYTLIPCLILNEAKTLYCLQSSDTCFPYKGVVNPYILKKIVWELINFSKIYLSRIDMIYGFPNKKYEKLSKFIFGWEKKSSLQIIIDLCPFLTYKKIKKRKSKKENFFDFKVSNNYLDSRVNTLFNSYIFSQRDSGMVFWFSKRFYFLQIISFSHNLNFLDKNKKSIKSLLNMVRLFITSIFFL